MRAHALIPSRPARTRRHCCLRRAAMPCWRWRHPPSLDDPTIPFDVIRREHSPPTMR